MSRSPQAIDDAFQGFRDQMPVARQWAYFDHAAVAPLPAPAADVLEAWARDHRDAGDVHWLDWNRRMEGTRQKAAQLVGAEPDEIALVANTTTGINLVADGFPWQPGDNVVTLSCEFPSNVYPWMNLADRGVETRLVEAAADGSVDLNRVEEACDTRTRIVSVSWVEFSTGWRNDLAAWAELAHRHGALLFVDAIQGLGAFPLDVRQTPIDFLAADGHKWMLGPEGAGLLYVRREHLDRLHPRGVGWNSVKRSFDYARLEFDLKESAGRYEGGTYNTGGFLALGESLALLLEADIEQISRRVLALTAYAAAELESRGAEVTSPREDACRSGILMFRVPGKDPVDCRRACLKANIVVAVRGGGLRLAPHAYNTEAEIDRLLDVLC